MAKKPAYAPRRAAYAYGGGQGPRGYRRRRRSYGYSGQFVSVIALGLAFGGMYLHDNYQRWLPSSVTFISGSQSAKTQPVTLPFCGAGARVNCIVDGDTIWLGGEKIRLEGLNAPEMSGDCAAERELAQQAKHRLRELLSGQSLSVSRNGHDAYGRTLATIRTNSGDPADTMIGEGLAHVWRGYKENWCD